VEDGKAYPLGPSRAPAWRSPGGDHQDRGSRCLPPRPLRPALQSNPHSLKVVLPRLKLVGDDGERDVHRAGAVVRGEPSLPGSRPTSRTRPEGIEAGRHCRPRRKPAYGIGVDAREAHDVGVESGGLVEVGDVERRSSTRDSFGMNASLLLHSLVAMPLG
jgi:hypothetical protein